MDEYVDQPVWCVVNWATGFRCDAGLSLTGARTARDLVAAEYPVNDLRVARWDDGRWVEAPPPEPEMKAPRFPWTLITAEGSVRTDRPTLASAQQTVTRFPDDHLRIFRLVEHQDGKVPVMLDRREVEAWAAMSGAVTHQTTLSVACRAALDAEDAS